MAASRPSHLASFAVLLVLCCALPSVFATDTLIRGQSNVQAQRSEGSRHLIAGQELVKVLEPEVNLAVVGQLRSRKLLQSVSQNPVTALIPGLGSNNNNNQAAAPGPSSDGEKKYGGLTKKSWVILGIVAICVIVVGSWILCIVKCFCDILCCCC